MCTGKCTHLTNNILYMSRDICVYIYVYFFIKKILNIAQNLNHTCVCFSQVGTFGILQWVMLIYCCHLIALQSLKQEVYTQLGVINIELRNESALAFVLHVLIKQSPSMTVKTKLRNLLNHGNMKN